MNIWKYYDGDLKYPNITDHFHEKEIAKTNAKTAYSYAVKHGKFPEGEKAIASNAEYSYQYAFYVLKNKFKLGEPAIAKNDYYAYLYATLLLKGPFPLGEPAIARNDYFAALYTSISLKKDFYLDGKLIYKYKG